MTAPAPTATVRKLGPGVLSFGSAGSTIDVSRRCKSITVKWASNSEDDTPVLSGDVEAGDRTYTATIEATVLQEDLADGSFTRWTWTHKGEEHPFTFTPYAGGESITGDVVVDPIDVGGDVAKKNDSDLKWSCVGEPEIVDDLS